VCACRTSAGQGSGLNAWVPACVARGCVGLDPGARPQPGDLASGLGTGQPGLGGDLGGGQPWVLSDRGEDHGEIGSGTRLSGPALGGLSGCLVVVRSLAQHDGEPDSGVEVACWGQAGGGQFGGDHGQAGRQSLDDPLAVAGGQAGAAQRLLPPPVSRSWGCPCLSVKQAHGLARAGGGQWRRAAFGLVRIALSLRRQLR